jgi:hypothetical protein
VAEHRDQEAQALTIQRVWTDAQQLAAGRMPNRKVDDRFIDAGPVAEKVVTQRRRIKAKRSRQLAGGEQADRTRSSITSDGSDSRHLNGKVERQGRAATPRLQGVKRDDR